MKQLLPTLLPILGLAVTAVAQPVQHAIASFVGTHPVWASVATVAGFVINHWLPSPNQPLVAK